MISLLEPTLTEDDLAQLFISLPRHCIVLLEDIDSAGLIRRDKNDTNDSTDDLAGEAKTAEVKSDEITRNRGISLSGLLNAIDGVASHEGR